MKRWDDILFWVAAVTALNLCLVGCSSSDKERIIEAVEPCIGLESEALRDCLVDQAIALEAELVRKAEAEIARKAGLEVVE